MVATEAARRMNRRIGAVIACATDIEGLDPIPGRITMAMEMEFDANKADVKRTLLDINDVIEEVISVIRHEVFSHGVSLRQELASELPTVLGDRVQLQQVIMNLVMNGIQAMSPVTGRQRELRIRSQEHGPDQILIAVEDSGIGIEPENVDQLFNAFFTTKPNGMGLGLSICRSIIEQHDGHIWATRNSGEGSTFQFTLRPCREMAS